MMISCLFFAPYARAAFTPTDVVGPFSPYPPYENPWVSQTWAKDWPSTSTGTSTGADMVRRGETTVTTATGQKVKIPVSIATKVSKVNIAKAAAKALRLTPQGVVAGVIVDKLVEEGIRRCFENQLEWCKEENVEPDAPPNFTWTLGGYTGMTWSSPQAACAYKKTQMTTSPYYSWVWTTVMTSQTTYSCRTTNSTGVVFDVGYGSGVSTCPTGYTLKTLINGDKYCTPTNPTKKQVPASDPDLQTATENQQNKNPGLSPQISEGARKDGQSPDKPEFGSTPTNVSAPPVTSAPRETGRSTTTNPDGSISTKTITEKSTVTPKVEGTTTGDTRITHYVTNTTTYTTIVNNSTNQTTIVEDVENSPDQPNSPEDGKEEDLSFSDAAMPDVPKLYTQKYPEGIAGAWRDHKPNISNTQFWAGVRSMFPEIGSGGACPNFSMSFGIGNLANYGSIPFDIPCWIYQAIGLIMLTTAAFAARKIIF
jgi:hypothetical protein